METTLSTKYKELYDIDLFDTLEDIDKLNKIYKEVEISNNWEKYNKYEVSLIEKKLIKNIAYDSGNTSKLREQQMIHIKK